MSPVYRNLTPQFKLFILLSGMTLGGMLEADRRIRGYEAVVRERYRLAAMRQWDEHDDMLSRGIGLGHGAKGETAGRKRYGG
jgi:hypothetical protein